MIDETKLEEYWDKLDKGWKEKFNNDFSQFRKEIANGTARIFENGYEDEKSKVQ